jgi:hypothetical protein
LECRSFLSSWSSAAKIEMMGMTKRSMAMVTDNQRSSTLKCSKSISFMFDLYNPYVWWLT